MKSLKNDKSTMRLQKPLTKEVVRSREPSYIEFDSFKDDQSPLRVESLAKEMVRSREQSYIEIDSYKADKSPFRMPQPVVLNEDHKLEENIAKNHHTSSDHIPQGELSPSEETEIPTNQNLSSADFLGPSTNVDGLFSLPIVPP